MTDGGTQDLTTSVTWSSGNNGIATISTSGTNSGFASTHAVGNTTIAAQSGSVSASAAMTVTSATVSSIQIIPAPVSLAAGQTQQLLATATFTDGSSQDVTSSVAYTTSNASVVSVNTTGDLTAAGPGNATVTAMPRLDLHHHKRLDQQRFPYFDRDRTVRPQPAARGEPATQGYRHLLRWKLRGPVQFNHLEHFQSRGCDGKQHRGCSLRKRRDHCNHCIQRERECKYYRHPLPARL